MSSDSTTTESNTTASPKEASANWWWYLCTSRRLWCLLGLFVGAPLLLTILWLRIFGLPKGVESLLLDELYKRGIHAEVERLYLDPTGGVLAQNLVVYKTEAHRIATIEVDRVRIGIGWLSWWRGEPFVRSATVSNATIELPLDPAPNQTGGAGSTGSDEANRTTTSRESTTIPNRARVSAESSDSSAEETAETGESGAAKVGGTAEEAQEEEPPSPDASTQTSANANIPDTPADPTSAHAVDSIPMAKPFFPASAAAKLEALEKKLVSQAVDKVEVKQLDKRLDEPVYIRLDDVQAEVEFTRNGLEVKQARALLLDLHLILQGTLTLDAKAAPSKPTPEDIRNRKKTWLAIEDVFAEIESKQPIVVRLFFNTALSDPLSGTARVAIDGQAVDWRSVVFPRVVLDARLEKGQCLLDTLTVRGPEGEFNATGAWKLDTKSAFLNYNSSIDFSRLGPAFGRDSKVRPWLQKFGFSSPPQIKGDVKLDWNSGKLEPNITADFNWSAFQLGSTEYDSLSGLVAWSPRKMLVQDFALVHDTGSITGRLHEDKAARSAGADVTIGFDPTVLKGLLGAKTDAFLDSLDFPDRAPIITAKLQGTSFRPEDWKLTGTLDAAPFVYKGVDFQSANASFTFEDGQLTVPDMDVKRHDGGVAGQLVYNFKERWATFEDFVSTTMVSEIAPALGGKFPSYVEPYRFESAPEVTVNGKVDLGDDPMAPLTDMTIVLDAKSVVKWKLFGVDFPFVKPQASMVFKGRDFRLKMTRSGMHGGRLSGTLWMDLAQDDPPYETDLRLRKIDFDRWMRGVWGYSGTEGTADAKATFRGRLNRMNSMIGDGDVKIVDGYITSIPFLGPLSGLILGLGNAKADRASGTFVVKDGHVYTEDMVIESATLKLRGLGSYNFVKDYLDLDIRPTPKGPMEILFYVPSQVFKYNGTGPMKKVEWKQKAFNLPPIPDDD